MEINRDNIKFSFDKKIILNTWNIVLNILLLNNYINYDISNLLKQLKNPYKYNFISENIYLYDSFIICFWFDKKIMNYIWKNNKIFILDFYNEYVSWYIWKNNFIYYFSDIELYKEEFNFSYFIKWKKDLNIFIKLIFIKLIFNFYHKRNFNLKSVAEWNNERLDLIVWITCPNDCIFCNEWWISRIKKMRSIEKNKNILLKGKYDWVMLWEREPTISPDFIWNILMCKKQGINTISVITWWFYFSDYNFCEKVLLSWLNEIRISLHWSNSCVHDKITQKKWSFNIIIDALNNLSLLSHKYNFDIVILVVICKQNLYDLINILDLIKSYWISRISFAFVEIVDSAYINRFKIVPNFTNSILELNKLIKRYELYYYFETDSLSFENIPYCLMNIKNSKYIWKRSINYWEVFNNEDWEKSNKVDQYRKKEFLNKCYNCNRIDICEWINTWYKELFWEEEFNPIADKSKVVSIELLKTLKNKNLIIDLLSINNIEILRKIIIIYSSNWYLSFLLNRNYLLDIKLIKIKNKYNLIFYKKWF